MFIVIMQYEDATLEWETQAIPDKHLKVKIKIHKIR